MREAEILSERFESLFAILNACVTQNNGRTTVPCYPYNSYQSVHLVRNAYSTIWCFSGQLTVTICNCCF